MNSEMKEDIQELVDDLQKGLDLFRSVNCSDYDYDIAVYLKLISDINCALKFNYSTEEAIVKLRDIAQWCEEERIAQGYGKMGHYWGCKKWIDRILKKHTSDVVRAGIDPKKIESFADGLRDKARNNASLQAQAVYYETAIDLYKMIWSCKDD